MLEPIATGREQITQEILHSGRLGGRGVRDRATGPEVQADQLRAGSAAGRLRPDDRPNGTVIAEEFTAPRGRGSRRASRVSRERDLARIQSEAFRTAEELRGTADAEATGIYAAAYDRDAAFYAFTKSLETYEKTMDPSTVFILGTDSELLRFLEAPR